MTMCVVTSSEKYTKVDKKKIHKWTTSILHMLKNDIEEIHSQKKSLNTRFSIYKHSDIFSSYKEILS